jgi:hypothetical protein
VFSPGDGDTIVPAEDTAAAVPKTRNSGPLDLPLRSRRVPEPVSFCSHR